MQDIRAVQRELDFDTGDWVYLGSASDGLRADLGQGNSSQLASLDKLGNVRDGILNRDLLVDAGALENVEGLLAVEDAQAFVDAPLDVFAAAIRLQSARLHATLDRDDYLVGVIGILGEVVSQQVQRIKLWGSVELATVPEIGAAI